MSKSFERYQKRKLISSYFSVVLSIALVLFLLGCLGLLVINTNKLANHFKEQVAITVYLKDNAKEDEINQLQKSLAMAEYTKSATFVSKEEAAEAHSREIGENFLEFLGYNPLQNSIDVHLNAAYVATDSIAKIAEDLSSKVYVSDVAYDKPLTGMLNENVKRLSLCILISSGVITLIAVLLITTSVRLSAYRKRFIMATMQLVRATKRFIRRPFIWNGIRLGMVGALVAMAPMGRILLYVSSITLQLLLRPVPSL